MKNFIILEPGDVKYVDGEPWKTDKDWVRFFPRHDKQLKEEKKARELAEQKLPAKDSAEPKPAPVVPEPVPAPAPVVTELYSTIDVPKPTTPATDTTTPTTTTAADNRNIIGTKLINIVDIAEVSETESRSIQGK